jgi:diguanylate cyclase (GGDEF)-like protein
MRINLIQWRSFNARVTLFTLAIFVASMWGLTFYISRTLRQDYLKLLGDQQFSTATLMAYEVNEHMAQRLESLQLIAALITPQMLAKPEELQTFLEGRKVFMRQFNGGSFVTGVDGVAIASYPKAAGREGVSFADRDYISDVIQKGKPAVGQPVIGRLLKTPVFGMSAPIHDAQGHGIGVLVGITNLGEPNFLDSVTSNRYGKTGGYFLVTPQHRRIVTGSDRKRVMEILPAPGVNPQIDSFIDGFEGSTLATNPFGVHLLVSIKRMSVTDWYLSVILPVDEAFGPIADMQVRIWLMASFLTLLTGTLTWWMLRRQLKPLRQAVRTLALQESAHLPMKPLPVSGADEITQLISAFNSLLATLREREQKLTSSEARLRTLSEMSSDFFWETDAAHRVVLHTASNPRGDGSRAILSMPLGARRWDIPSVAPDESGWQVHREMLEAHKPFRNFEISRALPDGSVHHVSVSGDPVFDAKGHFTGYLGIGTDVTQAKEAQFQIQSLAFFDPLTGLPNRRLLMDRLKVAIANLVRHQRRGALLFVDLDNFKQLNDTLGHEAGDLLLKQVATGLTACIREGDTVARLGGDEFIVMLEDLSAIAKEAHLQAETVANKILQTLNQSYQLGAAERRVTPSIGVTLFGDVLENVDEPLKRADLAMYKAKGAGRNTVQFLEPQA